MMYECVSIELFNIQGEFKVNVKSKIIVKFDKMKMLQLVFVFLDEL